MILPKEPMYYEKMDLDLIEFHKMLGEYKLEGISGYILLDIADFRYVIFLEKGIPIRVLHIQPRGEIISTLEDVRQALRKTSAYVKVVKLPWHIVDQMVRIIFFNPLYTNLLTNFVDFQDLLQTIEEKHQTGIMELLIRDRVHYLIIKFGIPHYCVLQYDSAVKQEPVNELLELVKRRGALINFYEPRDFSLFQAFKKIGDDLFKIYRDLYGRRLSNNFQKKMIEYLKQFENVQLKEGEYQITNVDNDIRYHEKIIKEILHHQIILLNQFLGRPTTYRVYTNLLNCLDPEIREIFREVIL